eukprot:TRINITY_DN75792_c0_g1_i1.p1 TRINITY_DN75792_c0_g1~~TRINITY_DN75792_c0_g1_i1.p1  ORF type:complete len:856 (+),score=110.57 TRINITY_DN75792_c0_g1_i1:387-2570(+)
MLVVVDLPLEDASTEAGSDRGFDSSVTLSSEWSEDVDSKIGPGPGAYSPEFGAVTRSTVKGTPSFGRYCARAPPASRERLDEAREKAAGVVKNCAEDASTAPPKVQKARGGVITPLPVTQPRAPTTRVVEERSAARRPFYDSRISGSGVSLSAGTTAAAPAASPKAKVKPKETGRLDRVARDSKLGPGSYNLKVLVPGGRGAFISLEPSLASKASPSPGDKVTSLAAEVLAERSSVQPISARPVPPGPAQYDGERAMSLVFPRASAPTFGASTGHSMSFQSVPRYVVQYRALDPRWDAVRRRSLSAVILPVARAKLVTASPHSDRLPPRHEPGPCDYDITAGDRFATRRVRSDILVLPWKSITDKDQREVWCGEDEASFVGSLSPRLRGRAASREDKRRLMGQDDDLVVRRRHASAVIHPLSSSLPARPAAISDSLWHFQEPPPAPPPEGLASFSRRIPFEDFKTQEQLWLSARNRVERRRVPSLCLPAYSLPHLEATKARAPKHDFGLLAGRQSVDPREDRDLPLDGDVLLLSIGAERELLHPRVPSLVNMCRQLGRVDTDPHTSGAGAIDDFEELILSPRAPQRRESVYVDMARAQGRSEQFHFSANLWADADGTLYAYQPTAGLRLRPAEADELLLSPRQCDRHVRRRSPETDFRRALGREGVDPRMTVPDRDAEDEVLLTNWAQPFSARRQQHLRRSRSVAASGPGDDHTSAGVGDGLVGGAD